jgi:hypothetical protein
VSPAHYLTRARRLIRLTDSRQAGVVGRQQLGEFALPWSPLKRRTGSTHVRQVAMPRSAPWNPTPDLAPRPLPDMSNMTRPAGANKPDAWRTTWRPPHIDRS